MFPADLHYLGGGVKQEREVAAWKARRRFISAPSDGWDGLELEKFIFYEIHTGTFTPQGTFEAIIPRLPELRRLGVTALELMPVAEFPGAHNWGYDGTAIYAPHSAYGGPTGLRELVDACHRSGFAVVLDVVYNHLGPEGNYLAEFAPYFTESILA